MADALRIKNLSKSYGDFSLKDVSFTLPQGSIMGFIGENGAGKTTALKAMLNIIKKDAGEVEILGLDGDKDEKGIRGQIGVVFDESNFHDNLKTREIAGFMSRIYSNWDHALFARYLKTFELPGDKIVKQFSRGMKIKLCIAAALAHRPRLLILDEATSGLDPVVRDEILDIFLEYIQDEGNSILISSHITSDLDKIADYVAFIHKGCIVFSRQKDELLDDIGILKCGLNEYQRMEKSGMLKLRKNAFGADVLISGKRAFARRHPEAMVDAATIEEIMLFFVRGEKV